jgi:hypothetical protein
VDDDAESAASGEAGAALGDEVSVSVPRGEAGAVPEDDRPGPVESRAVGELGQEPGKEFGEAVPAGDHGKGGWTTMSVGNREEGSGAGVVVGGLEKGKTDSSNTT